MKKTKFFKRLFKILLLAAIFLVLFLIIRSTYSKYVTGTDDTYQTHISKWHILLNNKDIMSNANFTQDVDLFFEENTNIAERVIAPTSKGYFEVFLESTGTEVPFEYDIRIAKQSFSTSFSSDDPADYTTTDGTNTTYELTLDFDYPETGYVWKDNGNNTFDYKCPKIELTVPSGFLLNESVISWLDTSKSNTQSGNKITLYAQRTAWAASTLDSTVSSNHFRNTLKLTFNHEIDLSTTELISAVKINNTELSNTPSNLPDFRISKYTIYEEREAEDVNYMPPSTPVEISVPRDQTSIIGTVLPAKNITNDFIDTDVKYTFHFEIEWYDEADNTFNNLEDVAASKSDFPIGVIPVNVKVTQIEE